MNVLRRIRPRESLRELVSRFAKQNSMLRNLLILSTFLTVVSTAQQIVKGATSKKPPAGRCTGQEHCPVCTTCENCRHCAQDGGQCGACTWP